MHTLTLLSALLTWSEQVCLLAAAATLASFAIANPKIRLAMWQGLLLIALLLPAIEPWRTSAPQVAPSTAVTLAASAAPLPPVAFHWRAEYWLWLIAAGALLRVCLAAAGFLRLRSYRQQARPLPEPPLRFASSAASWYASDAISGPVTYGWRHPVILLPSQTLDLPGELREAIECHELIHVHRGDWAYVLAETLVRSVLWFHPAVWFVMNRIQLSREQVVDREVVHLLHNRDHYLDALVAVARYQLGSGIAPAFLRKRQLLARVNALFQEMGHEIGMSRSRIAAGAIAACSILPVAVFGAMWLFPFVSQAQTPASPPPPSPVYTVGGDVTTPIVIKRVEPQYSEQARKARWGGTVLISMVIDEQGVPRNLKVIKPLGLGLDEKAIEAASQWRFRPATKDGAPVSVAAQIELTFNPLSND
jgi:TonB family protein